MEDIYNKLLTLTEDDTVQLASSFKDLIGKELVLGQTRFMCRYGTLSDGHEKLTDSQRYYQALKEMHLLASNMRLTRANAMTIQADIMEIEEKLSEANKPSEILRLKGKLGMAKENLLSQLITVEDQSRMIDEYNKVRLELQDKVRAQYPEGIEQAEKDNWEAVIKFRLMQRQAGFPEKITSVPMSAEDKAKLGVTYNAPDLVSWLVVDKEKEINNNFKGDLIAYINNNNKLIEEKK